MILKSSKHARRHRINVEAEAREKEHMVKWNNVSDACINYEYVYDDAFYDLFYEDDDAIGESSARGSVANERGEKPCENLMVAMPFDSDNQDAMS